MQRRSDRRRPDALGEQSAEVLALRALTFLADQGMLDRFCSVSGVAEADLRARLADPDLLGAVLDFLADDDMRMRTFCDWAETDPETVVRARHRLPGAPVGD